MASEVPGKQIWVGYADLQLKGVGVWEADVVVVVVPAPIGDVGEVKALDVVEDH